MSPTLALPAAKLALSVAGDLVNGVAKALDPAKAKAKKQADDFETMFLEQVTDQLMTATGSEGPLGENGIGGDVYRSMLTKEYAKQIQRSGGVGLSNTIMSDLLRMQEQNAGAAMNGAARVAG